MAAQGKGLIVALAMIIITMFGAVTVFQMSHDGIEFSMNVHHITIGGSAGEYSIGASLDIENTNDFDIAIRTAEVEVYQSEAEEHLIFSHSIEQRIALKDFSAGRVIFRTLSQSRRPGKSAYRQSLF